MDENETMDMSFSERITEGVFKVFCFAIFTSIGIVTFLVGFNTLKDGFEGHVYATLLMFLSVLLIVMSVGSFLFVAFQIVEFARNCKNHIISDEHEDSSVELR